MASMAQWWEGARPRTLPAAISPVVAGTGIAVLADSAIWWRAGLALVVALALQVGVNYANDYSDGIKGTDDNRVGPLRLVGSRTASAHEVKRAAMLAFGVAAVIGLVLALITSWWLVAVGALAIAAAWYYTGGSRPYGYSGLGEVSVFVFFGLVAVLGTAYVQTEEITPEGVWAAAGIGSLACAILVANNLRDIPTDALAGKRTLAVRMGDAGTRQLFVSLHGVAYAFLIVLGRDADTWWVLLALISIPFSVRALVPVWRGAVGRKLIGVLRDTGACELLYAIGILAGAFVAVRG